MPALARVRHRAVQQRVCVHCALALRGKVVGLLEVDRVDLGELDEVVKIDRLGPAGFDGVHLLVGDQDIVTLAPLVAATTSGSLTSRPVRSLTRS